MRVWGAADVDAAADEGATLRVGPDDLVTPLARERARELGVEIAASPPGPAAAPAEGSPAVRAAVPRDSAARRVEVTPSAPHRRPGSSTASGPARAPGTEAPPPPVRPPSGALYRRGAPLPGTVPGRSGGATGRAVVVGAGHVGMITALRLADADVFAEIVLVDVDEVRAAGIALDLTHTAALGGFTTRIRGVGTVEEAGPADYAVITAGKARQPGMSRSDLVSVNAAIVGDVAGRIARTSPGAVIVVVTNPLDEMTHHAWKSSGLPPERVIGMAGVLDTARFKSLAALEGLARADRIEAVALGSHGDAMVIPLSQASVGGRPLSESADPADLHAIVDRTRASGAEVVGLLRSGSAFMAPGTSTARMVLAMVRDSGEVMPATVLADGSYGLRDVYIGLPARLGRGGVREIVELDLRPDELDALHAAAKEIRERVDALAAVA